MNVSPHVAQDDTNRRSAIDRCSTRHRGYAIGQRIRKRIEEGFGWTKTIGGMGKLKHRGPRTASVLRRIMTLGQVAVVVCRSTLRSLSRGPACLPHQSYR